jgi:hypothetical protein|tara:strand:- start:7148 stop:8050 length:903 start_codon:yes stop_codon:yes gene_type:complete|mmetsp:Transcript_6811/g.23008  ORF Transcript_6811/g.23008 Transcript_6811/m.23008 type:complete len:301 (+) Transcript_6811:33-935(+)
MSTSLLSSACPVARSVPRALRRAYRSSASPSRLVHTRAKKKNDVLFGEETVPPLPPSYDSQDYSQDEPAEPACALAYASVDNEAHPEWSLLQVDVTAVSGVMRILSWLMNGLDLDVKSAEWDIEYGAAQGDEESNDELHIKLWVVEGYGKHAKKIMDAKGLEGRVTEYLRFCTDAERKNHTVLEHRGIRIDNTGDDGKTRLRVRSHDSGAQSFLSLTSTVTGLGLRMNHADLTFSTGKTTGDPISVWSMELTDFDSKSKLSNTQVQGLLYTLALVFGKSRDGGFGGADYLVEKMVSGDEN